MVYKIVQAEVRGRQRETEALTESGRAAWRRAELGQARIAPIRAPLLDIHEHVISISAATFACSPGARSPN